jgi:hypothetical protein
MFLHLSELINLSLNHLEMFNEHLNIIGGSLHNIMQLINISRVFQQMILHLLIKVILLNNKIIKLI